MFLPIDVSFGPHNSGSQVAQNQGSINNAFNITYGQPETLPEPQASIPFFHDPTFVQRGDLLDSLN
jgi:hypothetical protein